MIEPDPVLPGTFGEQACRLLDVWPRQWVNVVPLRYLWWRIFPTHHVVKHSEIGLFCVYWYGRVQHCGLSLPGADRGKDTKGFHCRTMTWREQLAFYRQYRKWRALPFDLNKLPISPGDLMFGP